MRRVWIGLCLTLVLGACGGGDMSVAEYVDRLNEIVGRARQQYEELVTGPEGAVLVAERHQLGDFTPEDLRSALDHVRAIEAEVDQATAAIDPPHQIADLHNLFFDFDSTFIAAQEAVAARAGTAADWDELSRTPEMTAYRAALAADKHDCADMEAELNAIGERRELLTDTPWIAAELQEVFQLALGCDGYPAQPEDLYRPVPIP